MRLSNLFNFSDKKNVRANRTPGGIRPRLHKSQSLRSRIMSTPIPSLLIIPLHQQQQGKPSIPCVKAGEHVLKYQLIASAAEPGNLDVYAPSSGKVTAIENHITTDTGETEQCCIFLQTDGEDQPETLPIPTQWRSLEQSELTKIISRAGICGMGGAAFPTAKKLNSCGRKSIDTVIINAAECEPFISADQALIRERPEQIVTGAEILQQAIAAKNCIIAIEAGKKDAIEALSKAVVNTAVKLIVLDDKYPAGGERQLIQAVSGRELPWGMLPADIGMHVQNTGTVFAIYNAVVHSKPCISRIITLTGAALQTPKNFEVLIGTTVSYLFELCGLEDSVHSKTIVGGSLMGTELNDVSAPVSQSTNCLVAGSLQEFPDPTPQQACIRCGFCAEVCPANLLPQQLYAYAQANERQQLHSHGLQDCIECGACAYVCPSNIPLVQYYRAAKEGDRLLDEKTAVSNYWKKRFQFHQYRIKKLRDDAQSRHEPASKEVKAEAGKTTGSFSRDEAKLEIAAAVARVKARKKNVIASSGDKG